MIRFISPTTNRVFTLVSTLTAVLLTSLISNAVGKEPTLPDNVKITEKEVILGDIRINRITKEIHIDAEVCLRKGLLEYIVCSPNTFEHESIFTTKASPELIHLSLVLIKAKPTKQIPGLNDLWYEKVAKAHHSHINIEVEWKQNGKTKRIPLIQMLQTRSLQENAAPIQEKLKDFWVFAGSYLVPSPKDKKNKYAANLTGIVIGAWPERSTVIQYGVNYGDPYKGSDLGLAANTKVIPKVGQKVKLILSHKQKNNQ